MATDYARRTRQVFLLGLGLFLVGVVGGLGGQALFGPLPDWEQQLLIDAEALGILLGLFGPLVYGVVLPLVE